MPYHTAQGQQQEFLQCLFQAGEIIELRVIDSEGRLKDRRWFNDPLSALPYAREASDHHVFFGVGVRRNESGGDKKNVARVRALFVDIDNRTDLHGLDDELSDKSLPRPSAVICSGRGYHLYWFLDEAYIFDRPESVKSFEARLRNLQEALSGDPACNDVARILRLPGSRNVKPDCGKMCEILDLHPERKYAIDEFPLAESVEHEDGPPQDEHEIREGKRNGALFRRAASLRARGLKDEELLGALRALNQSRCKPPLGGPEVEAIAKSACRYEAEQQNDNTLLWHWTESWPQMEKPMYRISRIALQNGINALAAPSKAGKTWLLLHFAVCIATGKPVFGRYQTTLGKVLFIQAETDPSTMQERLRSVVGNALPPQTIAWVDRDQSHLLRLDTEQGRRGLLEAIDATGTNVVILDTVRRLWGGDENSSAEVAELFGFFQQILRLGCDVIYAHHVTKLGDQAKRLFADPTGLLEKVRGSGDFVAGSDHVFLMKKELESDELLRCRFSTFGLGSAHFWISPCE